MIIYIYIYIFFFSLQVEINLDLKVCYTDHPKDLASNLDRRGKSSCVDSAAQIWRSNIQSRFSTYPDL